MTRATGGATDHAPRGSFSLLTLTANDWLTRLGPRFGLDVRLYTRAHRGARVALYLLITWAAPLFLVSVQAGRLGTVSFMADFETHLRSLVAIPLLVFAESQIDPEVRYVVRSLASARLCRRPDELRARVHSLQPLATHPAFGLLLLLVAFLFVPAWIRQHTSGPETWIFRAEGPRLELTAAGMWQAWVVVPLYVFLLLRWLWRWVVLTLVFARSAPLLRPVVSHGDRCGGFSFVSNAPAKFAWVIAGASTLVSARWLVVLAREEVSARSVVNRCLAIVIVSVMLAFFPLLVFVFHFGRAKRSGLRRYRAVLEGHARNVEREWYRRPYPAHVSSEESSSLTDLNSVYDCVRTMRIVPYRRRHVIVVALAALAPLLPALSLLAPLNEIFRDVLKALL
ncbi:MAG: hypothetical protein K0S65_5479 [Labilithrix sp.]|nr:hypothetical protein [Labilithrix sp.]